MNSQLAVGMLASPIAAPIYALFEHAWPDANEGPLRQAAGCWDRMGGVVRETISANRTATRDVTHHHAGAAADALTAHMRIYSGDGDGRLGAAAAACEHIATVLREFAAVVEQAKDNLRNAAIELGVSLGLTLAAAGVASLFTGPVAIAAWVANGIRMAYAAIAAATSVYLAVLVVGTGVLAGAAALGALEAFVSNIVSQPLKFHHSFSLDEAVSAAKWGAASGPATVVVGAAGHAVAAGVGAVRAGDGLIANRLRNLDLASEQGSFDLSAFPGVSRIGNYRHIVAGKGVNGILRHGDLHLLIERGPGLPPGREMYDAAIAHYGRHNIKRIVGDWESNLPTNLNAFNRLIRQGASPEAAARATWSGQQAARHGFTHVSVERLAGEPGSYSSVLVHFY